MPTQLTLVMFSTVGAITQDDPIIIDASFDDWLGNSPFIFDGEDVNLLDNHMDWQAIWIKT